MKEKKNMFNYNSEILTYIITNASIYSYYHKYYNTTSQHQHKFSTTCDNQKFPTTIKTSNTNINFQTNRHHRLM